MLISGLQKLTLLDYPGVVACTVFTGGCNLRCPFCHNSSLVLPERLAHDTDADEVLAFLKKRHGTLDGVAVTGGEPLLQKDVEDFLREVRAMGYKIKLDTNGSFPEKLIGIVEAGLVDRVAMDIKSSPAHYGETVGIPGLDLTAIEKSKEYLLSNAVEYEFRTTVVKGLHTADIIRDTSRWICGAREYYLQQFKDSGDVLDITGLDAFDKEEMYALADIAAEFVPSVQVRGV